MAVSKTSPDGSQVVERVELDGRTYDLPPWITGEDFAAGIRSDSDENPLSSLISCELADWALNEDYDADEPEEGPEYLAVFTARWFLPYGSIRELVAGIFTPQLPEDWRAPMFAIEFTVEGAVLAALVVEYRDITDVQVYLLPEPISTFTYEPRYGADSYGYSYLEESFEEFREDPSEFIERVSGPGIDGQVARTTGPDGKPYLLLLNFHED